jgi:3-hydroxybutyryl-CoA dehydrogenase
MLKLRHCVGAKLGDTYRAAALDRSRARLEESVARAVSRDKMSREDVDSLIERIAYTSQIDDLGGVDAMVEAVTEDPRVKCELFAQFDKQLPDAQFLASNTSSIPIAELAAWTQRPER